jgi:hypothetical protein
MFLGNDCGRAGFAQQLECTLNLISVSPSFPRERTFGAITKKPTSRKTPRSEVRPPRVLTTFWHASRDPNPNLPVKTNTFRTNPVRNGPGAGEEIERILRPSNSPPRDFARPGHPRKECPLKGYLRHLRECWHQMRYSSLVRAHLKDVLQLCS